MKTDSCDIIEWGVMLVIIQRQWTIWILRKGWKLRQNRQTLRSPELHAQNRLESDHNAVAVF